MLYCCSWPSVGVPEKASNRSTAVTPGSASIWPCMSLGGPAISAYAISTRNPVGVQLGDAVAEGVVVGVGVRVAVGDAEGLAVGVGVGLPHGVRM